ncbi:MAG: hypothetical protein GX410_00890 [Elusimicrobia bacterium]|nr:hypothetical protein [Elusimicrobiota bacterium]
MNRFILVTALSLSAAVCAAAADTACSRLQVSRLDGHARIHSQSASYDLKRGDALPSMSAASADVQVSTGAFELLACGEFRIRSGAGAAFALQGNDDGSLTLKTAEGSAPVQLSDAAGNVLVATPGTEVSSKRSKKKAEYAVARGKAVLTDTNGSSYILKEKSRRAVDAEKITAPKSVLPQEAAGNTEEAGTEQPQENPIQDNSHETAAGN